MAVSNLSAKICVLLHIIFQIYANETTESNESTTSVILPAHMEVKDSDLNSIPAAKGEEFMLRNFSVYESPFTNDSKILLITAYDIFGFHPHVKYIADELAKSGFLVVIPDLFHGKPVPLEPFPPSPSKFAEIAGHLFNKTSGAWVQNKPDLLQVIGYYKEKYNITRIGIYGYCWGGFVSVSAASDPDFKDINAIGLVHPSRVNTEDAKNISIPAILLPSSAEPDMLPFLEILYKNANNNTKSEHHRYNDMKHGFAGAKSDFSDKAIRRDVQDVIKRLTDFFKKTLMN